MLRKVSACVAVAGVLSMLLVWSAVAQDKKKADAPKKPDATVKLSEGSVAAGIGWTWGKGELTYKGKKYKVKVDGLSVGEVGITKAEATGNVFNLKKLEDFDGVYATASAVTPAPFTAVPSALAVA